MNETIDWENVIKEARGLDDYDLGEVQEVNGYRYDKEMSR